MKKILTLLIILAIILVIGKGKGIAHVEAQDPGYTAPPQKTETQQTEQTTSSSGRSLKSVRSTMTQPAQQTSAAVANEGSTFKINTTTAAYGADIRNPQPSVIMENNKKFIISYGITSDPNSPTDIFFRRFKVNSENKVENMHEADIKVNTYRGNSTPPDPLPDTLHDKLYPQMTITGDDELALVWQSVGDGDSAYDQDRRWYNVAAEGRPWGAWGECGIYMRRFDKNNDPLYTIDTGDKSAGYPSGTKPEIAVNTTKYGNQHAAWIASSPDKKFSVITWSDNTNELANYVISAKIFNANGDEISVKIDGAEMSNSFQAMGDKAGDLPVVVINNNRILFVAQGIRKKIDGIRQDWGKGYIFATLYSYTYNSSTKIINMTTLNGGTFQVSREYREDAYTPTAGISSDGTFAIAWQSINPDTSNIDIYAKIYKNDGAVIAKDEFPITSATDGDQQVANISMNKHGDFIITWQSNHISERGYDIYAKIYGRDGQLLRNDFLVNNKLNGANELNQTLPRAALNDNGNFIITWQDEYNDVYARYFNDIFIFIDLL